eukprot:CAMPEP_0172837668 /NCGR_PEP_ID=MMETSP1075-20121228/27366_1 /TAXON_ID=2916 /ORGANISM="Ceratium fusus, Strain PA161109" /LENGTH=52 /DNA_ID=CAMNT_0013681087 /DNA_START=300 /DNA_END=454 /DNA_ORIENTATION=+
MWCCIVWNPLELPGSDSQPNVGELHQENHSGQQECAHQDQPHIEEQAHNLGA